MTDNQITVTEKCKASFQYIDIAYKIYLREQKILHQNNDEYFFEKDYEDLLKIYFVKRIRNNLFKEFNEISDEEYYKNENELRNKINNLKKNSKITTSTIELKEELYKIENIYLLCKNSDNNDYYNFFKFVFNEYNFKNLSENQINEYLSNYSSLEDKSSWLDDIKRIYSHFNYPKEKIKNEISTKIESFVNRIQNLYKNRNN